MNVPLLAGFRPNGTPDPLVALRAARSWLAGGIVGLPTETVYGLAADAQNAAAVARVYLAKGRPAAHPLIVHVQGPEALDGWSSGHNVAAHRLVEAFWPGPLTVVVERGPRAADFITGGQETVALRCPDHQVARACIAALARAAGDPARGVAAPSANRFGRVSPTRAADVLAEVGDALDPRIDIVVDGGMSRVGVESTIVDCTVEPPRVLRPGAIGQAQVDRVLGAAPALVAVGANGGGALPATPAAPAGGTPVRAPGMLASHYAPMAEVRTCEAAEFAELAEQVPVGVLAGLVAPASVPTVPGWIRLASPSSPGEFARQLYAALRRADDLDLALVVAVLPDPRGGPLAMAVRDRLARAAKKGAPTTSA